MRTLFVAVLACCALGACKKEPSFDERYEAARQEIDRTAREIDAQISQRASDSAAQETAAADANTVVPAAGTGQGGSRRF